MSVGGNMQKNCNIYYNYLRTQWFVHQLEEALILKDAISDANFEFRLRQF